MLLYVISAPLVQIDCHRVYLFKAVFEIVGVHECETPFYQFGRVAHSTVGGRGTERCEDLNESNEYDM